uniref:Uncharacterized protein n=1 Tax=Aegilops tauschii subsp. strangulata TaxID=200361 RepID=A0A453PQ72_AEGTS
MEGFLKSTSAPEAAAVAALYNFSSFRTPDSPSMQEQQHEQAVLCNISRALSVQQNYSGVSDDSIFDTEVEDYSTTFVLVIITYQRCHEDN